MNVEMVVILEIKVMVEGLKRALNRLNIATLNVA